MPAADSLSVSRRQFLAGCAGCAAAAATPAMAESPSIESGLSSLGSGGNISPEGRASIAEVDRRFAQQRAPMQRTVRAVEDLGLDPSGGTPVNGALESALSSMSNTRILFPSGGTFALSGQITAQPDGPIELVGNGCTFVLPPNTETKSFVFVLPSGSLIDDIVIDQSATGTLQEFSVQTDGVVRIDNVTIKGYAPAKPSSGDGGASSMFSPIAETASAVVRTTNFTAVGGTAAGTHDESGLPPSAPENRLDAPSGVWVGQLNRGTVQLVNPTLSGWSNGIYGGRTTGRVEVRGGTFANNFNAQARIGGGSVVDGASVLLDDRRWSDKGPFRIGHQGVYVARVDAKHGNTTDPVQFVNLDVRVLSMRDGAALIDFESVSGPGIIRNCRFEHHLDRPVILGESPSVSGPTNIIVDQCLITGSSSASAVEIQNRPQSMVRRTCIALPSAGPGSISGAQIGPGVGFGPSCSVGGLANPSAVGSGGNISALNLSSVNGSVGGIAPPGGGQKEGVMKAMVTTVFMILVGIVGLIAGVLALAAIAGGLGLTLVYLLTDD